MSSLLDLVSREEHTITEDPVGKPEEITPEEPENVAGTGEVQNGKEEKSDETSTDVEGAEDALIGDALKTIASLESVSRTLTQFVKHGVSIDHESLVSAYKDISKAYSENNLKEPAPLVLSIEAHQTFNTRTKMVQELVLSVEGQINALLKNVQMIQDNRVARIKSRVAAVSQEALHPELSTEATMFLSSVAMADKSGGGIIKNLWNHLTLKQGVWLPFEAKDVSFFKSIKVGDEKRFVETLRRNIDNLRDGKQIELYPLDFRSFKNRYTDILKYSIGSGQLVNIEIPMTDRKLWEGFCKEIKAILDKNPDNSSIASRLLFTSKRHHHAEVTNQEDLVERFVGVLENLYKRAVGEFGFGESYNI